MTRQPPDTERMNRYQSQQGFSLLEIMIIMLITTILSATGIESLQRWHQQQHLIQSAQQTRQFLERIRNDANWHNRNHYLWMIQTEQTWCLSSTLQSDPPLQQCDPSTPWQLTNPWPEIHISDISQNIAFYGLRNTALGGHITLQSPAGTVKIIISTWGRIRSCRSEGNLPC